MGFLTNRDEEDKLATDEYRQQVAQAIYQSILKYFDEVQ
jgi:N-acetylmuramoyl-L-alanine amidase